ncbi:hypothetical protein FZEAL_5075 [Fusarium zealandicum]|uniref:Uncharacterized protein n=1 Tax=Fusarium zealandicum TaxID=1053134 RepID=A0A8H4UKY5_9HYPO|nr:hypothetical protein FZEAL_5075 [Fusarium zealandicum]
MAQVYNQQSRLVTTDARKDSATHALRSKRPHDAEVPCLLSLMHRHDLAATMAIPAVNATEAFRKDFGFLRYRQDQASVDPETVSVKRNAYWCYCGPLLDPTSSSEPESSLPANFYEFAAASFTGPVDSRFAPFLSFINAVLLSKGLGHYMLTVRATTPTHEFDRPRWHTDELFFSDLTKGNLPGTGLGLKSRVDSSGRKNGTNWKICTTLLGPSTLFVPLEYQGSARKKQEKARKDASTDHDCLSIRCVGCASAADSVREELASTLEPFGFEAAMPGECCVFKVGKQAGAIHSEPCMSDSQHGRIFINVVPGTEEELRSLTQKWGMEFPRQWWVGSSSSR